MLVPRSTWRGSSSASRLATSLVRLDKISQRRQVSRESEQGFEGIQSAWSAQSDRISQQLRIIDEQLSQIDVSYETPAHLAVYQSELTA